MDRRSRTGESFEACCVPWWSEIHNYALRLCRNRAQAEDLAQQVWMNAWEAWPEWRTRSADPKGDAYAWLRRIMRNRFLSSLRNEAYARRVLAEREDDIIDALHRPTTPSTTRGAPGARMLSRLAARLGVESETDEEVLQALAAVRKPWREFLRRRYFEGQSQEQIAAETGYGVSTVSSGISRGLAYMRPLVHSYARANYGLGRARIHPAM